MSSNTKDRIISAIVLVLIVLIATSFEQKGVWFLLTIFGLLIHDELVTNFVKKTRLSFEYFLSFAITLILIFSFYILEFPKFYGSIIVYLSLFLHVVSLLYLFNWDMNDKRITQVFKNFPIILVLLVLIPYTSLISLISDPEWKKLMTLLLFINFGMDTGAWLIGKKYGKRKLWEVVSPKKTVEGLIGGLLFSGFLGIGLGHLFGIKVTFLNFLMFSLMGGISQLGDLFQSKFKRQFEIKDSSSLIPGHGGVYDRFDSIIFLCPFFLIAFEFIIKT